MPSLVLSPLKAWFLGNKAATGSNLKRILLLDGGVNSHLEVLLLQQPGSASPPPINYIGCCSTNHNGGETGGRGGPETPAPPTFQYRELWSSSLLLNGKAGREKILQGHKDWLAAGADCLSTVTYQCHYERELWPQHLRNDAADASTMDQMIQDGVELAQEAVSYHHLANTRPAFCVASLGCYGAALANGAEYTGDYGTDVTMDRLVQFYQRKLKAHAVSRPDGVALETVPSHLECEALAKLLNTSEWQDSPMACWLSLACRNGTQLNDGTPLQTVLETLHQIPVSSLQAVGFNCFDSVHLPELVQTLVVDMATNGPARGIVLYPNSGEEWDATTAHWKDGTGCTVAEELALRLITATALIEDTWNEMRPNEPPPRIVLGGCCRTRPATIACLRKLVDDHLAAKE